jgi:hypothetical protein
MPKSSMDAGDGTAGGDVGLSSRKRNAGVEVGAAEGSFGGISSACSMALNG